MNAPLPRVATRSRAQGAYDSVAFASNEVAGLLARRLAAETQGEALFSPADRGRSVLGGDGLGVSERGQQKSLGG